MIVVRLSGVEAGDEFTVEVEVPEEEGTLEQPAEGEVGPDEADEAAAQLEAEELEAEEAALMAEMEALEAEEAAGIDDVDGDELQSLTIVCPDGAGPGHVILITTDCEHLTIPSEHFCRPSRFQRTHLDLICGLSSQGGKSSRWRFRKALRPETSSTSPLR